MKRGWMVLLLVAVGFAMPSVSHGQASVYGEFSATRLFGSNHQSYLYGGTTGILIDGPQVFHKLIVAADVQGRFVGSNGEHLDGVAIGPRFTLPLHRAKLNPYGEFMVGFARYNDGHGTSSSDYEFQVNTGVARPVSPHLDAVFEYSYSQFGYNGGQFNPKTFSGGMIFHFTKR
jgi:hypothetical protein